MDKKVEKKIDKEIKLLKRDVKDIIKESNDKQDLINSLACYCYFLLYSK